jgi:hypothetical protein
MAISALFPVLLRICRSTSLIALLSVQLHAQTFHIDSPCSDRSTYSILSNGKEIFVDASGASISTLPYKEVVTDFSEGFAVVRVDESNVIFIDVSGKPAFSGKTFRDARRFSGGVAAVRRGDKWGYINHEGEFQISPSFAVASDFQDGMAIVRLEGGGNWAYVDEHGNLFMPKVKAVDGTLQDFSDGMALVPANRNGATVFGYIGKNGEWAIEPQFAWGAPFSERAAAVLKYGKWGFIDLSGRFVVPPKYDEVRSFSEGFAAVRSNGLIGFVDRHGSLVIPYRYEDAGPFCGGLAGVKLNGKWGFIDKTGSVRINTTFERVGAFGGEIAEVFQLVATDSVHRKFIDKHGVVRFQEPQTRVYARY